MLDLNALSDTCLGGWRFWPENSFTMSSKELAWGVGVWSLSKSSESDEETLATSTAKKLSPEEFGNSVPLLKHSVMKSSSLTPLKPLVFASELAPEDFTSFSSQKTPSSASQPSSSVQETSSMSKFMIEDGRIRRRGPSYLLAPSFKMSTKTASLYALAKKVWILYEQSMNLGEI